MFLALAVLLGLRHAAEPDHLAAVSTLVARGSRRAAWTGAFWGLGHALSLLAVGAALLVLRSRMDVAWEQRLEAVVSVVLILLGLRALFHRPHHHAYERAPMVVGLIHGLAGSGALTAIALASLPSLAKGIAFIAAFGLGAAIGMALLAGLAGAAIRKLATPAAQIWLSRAAGLLSIGLGLFRLAAL